MIYGLVDKESGAHTAARIGSAIEGRTTTGADIGETGTIYYVSQPVPLPVADQSRVMLEKRELALTYRIKIRNGCSSV